MDDVKLTSSEWNVLNCLWEHSPRTAMQIVGELGQTVGWARSTTMTVLHRMEDKGLVRCEQAGRSRAYVPLVERDRAVLALRAALGKRVSAGLRYGLWAVVLVRLLVPVQLFTTPVTGTSVLRETGVEQFAAPPPVNLGLPPVPFFNLLDPTELSDRGVISYQPTPANVTVKAEPLPILQVLGWLWLAGAVVMIAAFVISNVSFARCLRRVRVPLDGVDCPLPVYPRGGSAVSLPVRLGSVRGVLREYSATSNPLSCNGYRVEIGVPSARFLRKTPSALSRQLSKNDRVKSGELNSGILCSKLPIDFSIKGITVISPSSNLLMEAIKIGHWLG